MIRELLCPYANMVLGLYAHAICSYGPLLTIFYMRASTSVGLDHEQGLSSYLVKTWALAKHLSFKLIWF